MTAIIGFLFAATVAVTALMIEAYDLGKMNGYEKGMDDAIKTFEDVIEEERLKQNECV